ncbi:MAG: hypothetical protein JOZ04_05750, partial [Acidimicrobiia bacterium]|nr:hypothetical protein [Acidimicrobiia bacterium]
MPASFLKRRARPLIFLSALLLLAAAVSRLAAQGSPPTLPLPGPHDPVAAARAGQLAGPPPGGPSPNSPSARSYQQIAGPPGPGAQPQVPWATARVFATDYNPNTSGSIEVSVPDKCVKFAALGDTADLSNFHCGPGYPVGLDYRVLITRDNGQSMYIPVKDVGPWNIDDNYWDPADSSYPRPRRLFGDLPRMTPESQAAYYNGYNSVSNCTNLDGSPSGHSGGADQFGRCVLNPSAVDISIPAASQLGFSGAEWITASFLWEPIEGLLAYPYGFRGGVFVTSGDLDADGKSEVITGADAGGGPDVEIYQPNGVHVGGFYAYGPTFGGGVRVASGGLDGANNIVTAPGPGGGPDVEIRQENGGRLGGYYAYAPNFGGGVYVATGKLTSTGDDEIVTGPGRGGGPDVEIHASNGARVGGFYAYAPGFGGGVRVATGDVEGNGIDDIITAAGPGGGPHVRIFRPDGTPVGGFMAYDPGFTGGVYVGTVRAPDNKSDWIVTGAGEGGGPHIRIFDAAGNVKASFMLTGDGDSYGVRVASGHWGSA